MQLSRKPTSAERAKIQEMDTQFSALQAEAYRIACVDPTGVKPPINLGAGKGPGGEEKLFSADEVKQKVRVLSAKNAKGYDIFATPIDSQRHYLVVDDMDSRSVQNLQDAGHRPALVQGVGAYLHQAVSVLPRADVSHRSAAILSEQMNQRYGDRLADPEPSRPFRLAGFTNQDLSRHLEKSDTSPSAQPLQHAHQIDEKAAAEGQALDIEMRDTSEAQVQALVSAPVVSGYMGEQEHQAARSWYLRHEKWLRPDVDYEKLDRELAIHLRGQGFSKRAVKEGITLASDNLFMNRTSAQVDEYLESKVADLYPESAEQKPETPRPAPGGAAPRPR